MSDTLAYALPARSPRGAQPDRGAPDETAPRHIEIVTTARQRRARPRIVYALVAVGGLFVILMAQLLLSIVLSDGAYQISSLQTEQKNLARDQQTLTESLHVLESPQNLAGRAAGLGMVMNSSGAGWLRLSDGAVLHDPAAAGAASAVDSAGQALITNVLLTPDVVAAQNAAMAPVAADNPAATAATPTGTATTPTSTTGAPTTGGAGGSVTSGAIPAPTTH